MQPDILAALNDELDKFALPNVMKRRTVYYVESATLPANTVVFSRDTNELPAFFTLPTEHLATFRLMFDETYQTLVPLRDWRPSPQLRAILSSDHCIPMAPGPSVCRDELYD